MKHFAEIGFFWLFFYFLWTEMENGKEKKNRVRNENWMSDIICQFFPPAPPFSLSRWFVESDFCLCFLPNWIFMVEIEGNVEKRLFDYKIGLNRKCCELAWKLFRLRRCFMPVPLRWWTRDGTEIETKADENDEESKNRFGFSFHPRMFRPNRPNLNISSEETGRRRRKSRRPSKKIEESRRRRK